MKYMVISDIHGGLEELNKVLNIYHNEKCSKLLILGDLFNYGIDSNENKIVNKLNSMKNDIICVRGNCDIDISDVLFNMNYIDSAYLNNKKVTLTHGHLFDRDYLEDLDSDIVLTGHTHIANIEKVNDKIFVNPGSISRSRRGENSFAIIDNDNITIRSLNNSILKSFII